MKEISTDHGKLSVDNFEEILNSATVILFNKDTIEIPGIVIFMKKESNSFISRVLNPSVEVIPLAEEDFSLMEESLKVHSLEKNVLSFDSKNLPVRKTAVNLTALRKQVIFVRTIEDSITVNDMIFTNNETEFHGGGMFTSKKMFFVGFEEMARIKEIFIDSPQQSK